MKKYTITEDQLALIKATISDIEAVVIEEFVEVVPEASQEAVTAAPVEAAASEPAA